MFGGGPRQINLFYPSIDQKFDEVNQSQSVVPIIIVSVQTGRSAKQLLVYSAVPRSVHRLVTAVMTHARMHAYHNVIGLEARQTCAVYYSTYVTSGHVKLYDRCHVLGRRQRACTVYYGVLSNVQFRYVVI